jgi:hypothetical protein
MTMMKRGPQQKEKKLLSATGLLGEVRKVFEKVPYIRTNARGRERNISLADSLMSALAMFSLKSPSLLAFDQALKDPIISHNLKSLYHIKQAPSDTYMREELDEVVPESLRKCFLSVFEAAQRGKLFEQYWFLDGYLILTDGTEIFNSEKISCSNCCKKNHRDGRTTYYHQVLAGAIAHPEQRQVIPLCPEIISMQDGAEKNDCERRATQRFLTALKKEHPRLAATIVSDALSANAPQINEIKAFGYHFIINVKPGSNKSLFDFISGLELLEVHITKGKNNYIFRYINNVPLNDSKDAPLVNFLECKATEVNGKRVTEKIFTWVTDHEITKNNVYLIMQGGRARWKIENETFNTLKNQGYQFEHNFGHGKKNLMTVFAFLMLLAFLIDQIQEAACGLFQAALQKMISRRALWDKIRCYFNAYLINSWEDLFRAIAQSLGVALPINSS